MEVIIVAVVLIAIIGYFILTHDAGPKSVTKALDANGDGKVDLKDAVHLGEVAVNKTKTAATKVKTVAKKAVAPKKAAAPKKPVAPKKAVKKPAVKKTAARKSVK
jgi:hypothetical protein